jgi:hypothetical protein
MNGIHIPGLRSEAMHGAAGGHELFFASLFHEGRGLAFPCDASGQVDLDRLPQRAKVNYLAARTLIGRDFASPRLVARCS